MELYYGDAFDDLVVPKDEEISDRLPSPGSWSKWGVSAPPQGLTFPGHGKRRADGINSIEDEVGLMDEFLSNDAEMESSNSGKRRLDGSASASLGSSADSLSRPAFTDDQSDNQHDFLAGIGQMDDLFLNSLLEALPQNHSAPGSFFFSPPSEGGEVPAGDLYSMMDMNLEMFSSDAQSVGSGRYLKTHAFSPSCTLEERREMTSHLSPCSLQHKGCPQGKVQASFFSEKSTKDGHVEEVSLEESVLQELESVLGQLTNKTRICFRDALFRLAQNSRQHGLSPDQDSDQYAENASNSSAGKKMIESETNPIDRAVANLLYTKMDANVRDFPVPASLRSTLGFADPIHAVNYRAASQAQGGGRRRYRSHRGDVEVPVFGQVNQQQTPS